MSTFKEYLTFPIACLIIVLSFACSSESTQPVGGPCSYDSFPGTAKFTELIPETNGVTAYFDFTLTDPEAPVTYLNSHATHLQIYSSISGGPTTTDWLIYNGISVGAEIPAVVEEIRHGACSPMIMTFPTITGAVAG